MSIYDIISAKDSKENNKDDVNIEDGPSGFQPIEEGDEFNEENERIKNKYKE